MENTKKLGIIPVYDTEDSLQTKTALSSEDIIVINNSQEEPIIQYKKATNQSGNLSWIRVDGSDSPKRSAKLSDLEYFLRERDWNIGFGRKVAIPILDEDAESESTTESSTTLSPTSTTSSTLAPSEETSTSDSFTPEASSYSRSVSDSVSTVDLEDEEDGSILEEETTIPFYMLLDESYPKPLITVKKEDFNNGSIVAVISDTFNTKETIDQFNSQYETLMNIKPMTYNDESANLGAIHYYNLISTRDLEKESTVIDLLSLGDSNYTNVLNINGLVSPEAGKNGTSCNLTVGINYTVNGKVYSKEISLDPIDNEEENDSNDENILKSKDILINILNYVTVDYHDFCLRAFPISLDVNECIISYCYITYYGINS